jgi:2-keto-4-pentenoate hydratase/2-oxohepta-3-ene-1,7-dioic acid hydratase in catechol pathway
MRLATIGGRSHIRIGGYYHDLEQVSAGMLPSDPHAVLDRWEEVREWAMHAQPTPTAAGTPVSEAVLDAPVPRPRQIFAVGLNYEAHAVETNLAGSAEIPLTFTKFASSIAGPIGELPLTGDCVDWEVELVAVIGRSAYRVSEADAWGHVAGVTVGQDFSDRAIQMTGAPPQFSLGKSFPGFSPIGPELVTIDELEDPDDLHLVCEIDGRVVQDGRTSHLIHPVSRLVSLYSRVCRLYPGDLIFTGTPDGVGFGLRPPRYLRPGEVVTTTITGVGTMSHRCVEGVGV